MGILGEPSMCRTFLCLIFLPIAALGASAPVSAQLISPGRLATPHSHLEGVRNCTNCHVLGERGISNQLCLDCHVPIGNRQASRRGLHGRLEQQCSECHKDHFGEDFQLVRFDTSAFDHSSVGFDLVESHGRIDCEGCHRPEFIVSEDVLAFKGEHGTLDRTLLGLGTTCLDCHTDDNPHGGQFAERQCTECHGQTVWEELVGFDHDQTRFRLTGRHRQVSCSWCHEPAPGTDGVAQTQYSKLSFQSCTACHDDVHDGAMGGGCSTCHSTAGWVLRDRSEFETRFDHESTGYSLTGAHQNLTCDRCHDPGIAVRDGISIAFVSRIQGNAYPKPGAETCSSCHTDYHAGVFRNSRSGSECISCHSDESWTPTEFGIARHNEETRFNLAGAHITVPCHACHTDAENGITALRFHFESTRCDVCHFSDDPHQAQFDGRPCDDCHGIESFAIAVFDHSRTNYPLDGAHQSVPCAGCHRLRVGDNGVQFRIYRTLGTECRDCHGGSR